MINCASPGSFSDATEKKVIKHILGLASWTPPSKWYLALGSGPSDSSFPELSGKGYARRPIEFAAPSTDENGVSSCLNTSPIYFGPADEDWPVFNSVGIFDAASGGNYICEGPLGSDFSLDEDQQLLIRKDEVEVRLTYSLDSEQRWSQYLQEKILRHVFRGDNYTPPSIYAAITNLAPSFNDTGSNLDEPNDSGYGRPQVTSWREPQDLTNGYSASSVAPPEKSFGTFTSNFTQKFLALCDASSGGNLLAFARTSIELAIVSGDTVWLHDGDGKNNFAIH